MDGSMWTDLEGSGRTTSSDGLLAYCAGGIQPHDLVRIDIQLDRKTPPISGQIELVGPITTARLRLSSSPK
jgi:hypothetical protein